MRGSGPSFREPAAGIRVKAIDHVTLVVLR
jgi:hypothetical protein